MMANSLRDKLIHCARKRPFSADTLVQLIEKHYAALAKPEPDGPGPTDEELAELWRQSNWINEGAWLNEGATLREFVSISRAVLARWGNPTPQPPSGEVAELVKLLRYEARESGPHESAHPSWCAAMDLAADLLERLSPPQPISVGERLPGPEDCDAEGRCWVWWKNGVRWVLDDWTPADFRSEILCDAVSHWIPAHALPLPSGEVGE